MASEFDASCENDPNFAVICAFLEKFGKQCGLPSIDFLELQQMLENSDEVPTNLSELIIKLLRRVKKTVKPDKWEKSLIAVTHTFSSVDAWEIERFGYKKAKLTSKVRVLKELLEMQFDYHVKFKNEINKLNATELRSQPLGRDKSGHAYWFHSDDNYQIRIYKEDLDDETWKLIAKDRESLVLLISKLSDGDIKFSSDSAVNEDSSSLSEKPLIDTGQPENDKEEKNTISNGSGQSKEESDQIAKEESDQVAKEVSDQVAKKESETEQTVNEAKQKENVKEEKKHERDELPKSEETKTQDPPVRPILRIKKLSELMDSGAKRQKLDDSQETTDSKSDVIDGETISEPVMVIKGDGTGEDNQSANERWEWNYEPSPIIGEEIEEDTFHVYGEGCGADCLTGNDGKATSSSGEDTNSTVEGANSSSNCVDDSIKSTMSELKDNKEKLNEVPSNKLDDTITNKTDNLDSATKENVKSCDDLDSKSDSTDLSKTEEFPDGSKSPVPKKTMFFFGSPLKNTSFSPSAKIEFGQVSPNSKETPDCKLNSDNNNEELNESEKDINGGKSKDKDSKETNDTNFEKENSEENTLENERIDSDQSKEDSIQTIKSSETTSEKCNEISNDPVELQEVKESLCIKKVAYQCGKEEKTVLNELTEDNNGKEETKVTRETPSVIANENDSKSSEVRSDLKTTESKMEESNSSIEEKDLKKTDIENNGKDKSDETLAKAVNEDSECVAEKSLQINNSSDETVQPKSATEKDADAIITSEESSDAKSASKEITKAKSPCEKTTKAADHCDQSTTAKAENCSKAKAITDESCKNKPAQEESTKSKPLQEDSSKVKSSQGEGTKGTPVPENVNKINKTPALNIAKTAKTIKDDQLHKSLRYFRTRRVANVRMPNEIKIPIKSFDPVLEAARRMTTVPISVPPKPIIEPPKKISTEVVYVPDRKAKTKKEREITPAASQKNNKKPKLISDGGDKDGSSKKDDKTNSSRSSPLSVADSVITLPDSLENSCAEAPEKDPLADSDADNKSKAMNLGSLSFDYNDSSTPPPIPSFLTRRTLRKRGRDPSPEPVKPVVNDSKKMKMKGKRQINTSLRKSIEEKKEQQVSSSDEVTIVPEIKPTKKTPKKKSKAKSRKKQSKKKAAKPTPKNEAPVVSDGGGGDDDEEVDDGNGEDQKETSATNSKQAANNKKDNSAVDVSDDESSIDRTPKTKPKTGKNTRILAGLEITDEDLQPIGVRQSRRLAQIKIKEQAEPAKKPEPKVESKSKKKPEVVSKKEATVERRKRSKADEQVIIQVPEIQEKKKKRKKDKNFSKHFDESKIWQSSSESSEADEDVEEEEEVIEEYEPPLEFKSDHEFSPESDIGSDSEYQPLKRARTARKTQELDQEEEDFPCQKCGKSDHPEWILLCDKCDNGWHCSCLRPPLLNIPEGDWHCPPCQHILLVENLQKKLEEYDKQLNKKVLEDRRKERLAYVGISLNNVLPSRENEHRKKKRRHSLEESDESFSEKSRYSDATESESDSDEPIYQLRQRRQAKSYKFNEYDELIKSAIQDEMEEVQHTKSSQSRGKDIATIVRAEEEERKEQASAETKPEGETKHQPDVEHAPKKEYSDDDEPIRPIKKRGGRKKGRKMTNLDISSEDDDERDEDFKGSNSSSEEEDDFEEEDSDDGSDYVSGKRRKSLRPVRRSTRVRVSRYDRDFINDDDEDEYPRKKKKRQVFSETESSDTDGSWKKKKKKVRSGHIKKRKGRKKDNILDELSDLEIKRKPKIKYGGLTSSEEETGRRRTRGKKTTYVDTLGSDSEEERKKRNPHRYIDSDDENDEDFVANEEDDEKESEGAPEDEPPDKDEEEDEDDDDDEPQEERRPLVIPKIYIKKPPVSKEILPLHANAGNKEPVKPVEKRIEEKEKQVENKVEPVITHEKEVVIDKNSNGINEIPKIESANNKPVETVPEPLKKPEVNPVSIEMVKKITNEPVKPAEEVSVKVEPPTNEYFPLIRSNEITVRPVIKPTITVPVVKPVELIPIPSVRPVELTAMEIEQEKKRKAFEEAKKMLGPSNSIEIVPVKRGRKPEEPPVKISTHEPIVSNVDALIQNDESNDELSEPPSVTLPMFEELANKNGSTGIRRKIGKGRPKKTLEEAVANLGGYKKESPIKVKSESELCIEIAAPPQPFSQASPVPSVITRMLQTSPGQTTAFPVGKIRPKQFATMPADDDDEPLPPRRGGSPQTGPHFPSPHIGQFLPGGPRGPMGQPYGQIHPTMSPYPRGILSPHQVRNPRPPMPSHMYPPHRMMPSGGGPLNMSEPSQQLPPSTNASNMKVDPQNYSRPPIRYPPISTPPAQSRTSPRPPLNVMSQMHQTTPANISQQYPTPSHQPPVSSGPPLSSGPPVSSGMPLPSGPPVSVGMPLASGPPVSIGMSLSSGPPRVSSGMALPSGPPPVSSGMPLPSGPPVSSGVPLPSGPPVSSGMSLPSGPPVSSGIPLPARPPPQQNYYGGYPHSEPMANEDAMPPSAYQGSPFQEEYSGEGPQEASENSNSKSYGGEGEETGEFGGLVSYFSSQREDDLDS